MEASLTSAAVLISYGAVLGKLNPFQVLIMSIIESVLFVANAYLGYTILGAVDVGGINFYFFIILFSRIPDISLFMTAVSNTLPPPSE